MRNHLRLLVFSIAFLLIPAMGQAEWDVDFSRRTQEIRKKEYRAPANTQEKESLFDFIFSGSGPIQEMVILNTDKGFVPSTVSLRQGGQYRVHVVNVNEKEKNVSFVMDAFSEHHATYYGKIKTFHIQPKKDGVYTFQCPETSSQGRLVVHPHKQSGGPSVRMPASRQ